MSENIENIIDNICNRLYRFDDNKIDLGLFFRLQNKYIKKKCPFCDRYLCYSGISLHFKHKHSKEWKKYHLGCSYENSWLRNGWKKYLQKRGFKIE